MKFKIDMNKLRDEIVCNIIRSRFLFSTEKWVTIRLSRWKFSGKFSGTCNVATKMNAEKNKIVLKYIQFWDILMLLFCENIVR